MNYLWSLPERKQLATAMTIGAMALALGGVGAAGVSANEQPASEQAVVCTAVPSDQMPVEGAASDGAEETTQPGGANAGPETAIDESGGTNSGQPASGVEEVTDPDVAGAITGTADGVSCEVVAESGGVASIEAGQVCRVITDGVSSNAATGNGTVEGGTAGSTDGQTVTVIIETGQSAQSHSEPATSSAAGGENNADASGASVNAAAVDDQSGTDIVITVNVSESGVSVDNGELPAEGAVICAVPAEDGAVPGEAPDGGAPGSASPDQGSNAPAAGSPSGTAESGTDESVDSNTGAGGSNVPAVTEQPTQQPTN